MEHNTMPQFWLKIIKPEQLEILQNDNKSGLTWGTCLNARRQGHGSKIFGTTDVYRRVSQGDQFVFYVIGSGVISYKAIVSENPHWAEKAEEISFMNAHKGKPDEEWEWVHTFKFTDILPIANPINLKTDKDRIPFLSRFQKYGTAFMNCSMWKLQQEDYDAIVNL